MAMDSSTAPTEKLNVVVTIGPARRVAARAIHLQGLFRSRTVASPLYSKALEPQLHVGVAASGLGHPSESAVNQ
jgi:hypothetical protein